MKIRLKKERKNAGKEVGCSKEIFEQLKMFRERKTDAQMWKAKRQILIVCRKLIEEETERPKETKWNKRKYESVHWK